MSIVNFAVTKPLEKQINQAIKEKGFTSKAEFFRFAAIRYVEEQLNRPVFADAADQLAATIRKKYRGKKIPSLRKQFADMVD